MLDEMKASLTELLLYCLKIGKEKGDLTEEQYLEGLETAEDIKTMDEKTFMKMVDRTIEYAKNMKIESLQTRLVNGAKYLEKPNLTPEQRQRAQKLFDEIDRELLRAKGWA